jgi:hypothetical protein
MLLYSYWVLFLGHFTDVLSLHPVPKKFFSSLFSQHFIQRLSDSMLNPGLLRFLALTVTARRSQTTRLDLTLLCVILDHTTVCEKLLTPQFRHPTKGGAFWIAFVLGTFSLV